MGGAAVTALSPAAGTCPLLYQNLRYVAIKKNMPISFICYTDETQLNQWYKTGENRNDLSVLDQNTPSYSINRTDTYINLTLFRATFKDSGIYVCDRKGLLRKEELHSCGTELRVLGEWQLHVLLHPRRCFFSSSPISPSTWCSHTSSSSCAGGTLSDLAGDALWHHRGSIPHCQSQGAGQPP